MSQIRKKRMREQKGIMNMLKKTEDAVVSANDKTEADKKERQKKLERKPPRIKSNCR